MVLNKFTDQTIKTDGDVITSDPYALSEVVTEIHWHSGRCSARFRYLSVVLYPASSAEYCETRKNLFSEFEK